MSEVVTLENAPRPSARRAKPKARSAHVPCSPTTSVTFVKQDNKLVAQKTKDSMENGGIVYPSRSKKKTPKTSASTISTMIVMETSTNSTQNVPLFVNPAPVSPVTKVQQAPAISANVKLACVSVEVTTSGAPAKEVAAPQKKNVTEKMTTVTEKSTTHRAAVHVTNPATKRPVMLALQVPKTSVSVKQVHVYARTTRLGALASHSSFHKPKHATEKTTTATARQIMTSIVAAPPPTQQKPATLGQRAQKI
tara:strand:- start:4430 stop:5182 length:753 start_codon:yes stop_codon:yes gene_type:complete